ncbi:hypothetical protein BG09_0759 [Bacillus thuringiensis serovar kurstaki str. HD-1]|nr:hypothetical protein BG09_0759 [Bacillus thuringiensis serovar kurstaki str. HD-1]MEB8780983.1 hypothetical protein [Bacillus cereus]
MKMYIFIQALMYIFKLAFIPLGNAMMKKIEIYAGLKVYEKA